MQGLHMKRDYGVIAKCPHCERTNIKRTTSNQITCGMTACSAAQNKAARVRREEREERKTRPPCESR